MRQIANRVTFGGLLAVALVGIFACCAVAVASPARVSADGLTDGLKAAAEASAKNPQDTTVYYLRGLDTINVEILRDQSPIYRQSPASAWSIRNNIFYDLSGTPNIGFEIPITGHSSLGANLGFKHWDRFFPWQKPSDYSEGGPAAGTLHGYTSDSKWRNLVIAPEYRFYIDTINTGLFLGADLLYTHYNTGAVKFPLGMYKSVREQRVQGDFFGLGLFAGYSWWLSDHWRLELEAGAALGYRNHRIFECAHCGSEIGKAKGLAAVPKLGLNIAYTFGERVPAQVDSVVWLPAPDTVRAIPFIPDVKLVEEYVGIAPILAKDNPVLRPWEEYRPYTPDIVLRKMDGPLYVHFELDKYVIKRVYRDNAYSLDKIVELADAISKDTTSTVHLIQIIGLASIEGREPHNQMLSQRRAEALKNYMQQKIDLPDSVFELNPGGEAWTEFRDQVNDLIEEGGDTGLSVDKLRQVLNIIDTEPNVARRETRIRALDGGRVYERLKEGYLADQRNSGYIRIYYDYVPDAAARANNASIAAMREGRHAEGLELLMPYVNDPRLRLTYGVALYYNGRVDEALAVLRDLAADTTNPLHELGAENLREMERVIEHNSHIGEPVGTEFVKP